MMSEWGGLGLAIAVSMDIFAAMSIKGARLRAIKWSTSIWQSLALAGWQTLVLYLCNQTHRVFTFAPEDRGRDVLSLFAVIILTILSVANFAQGRKLRQKSAEEYRKEGIGAREIASLAVVTSLDAVVAGVALGLLDISLGYSLFAVFGVNVLSVLAGLHFGYTRGSQQCYKAHFTSGGVLAAAGLMMLIQNFMT